jgi:hypothetical protein
MKTGNGKIANLPEHVRDELNWRINDGDEGKELVDWLNAKPEVVEVVTKLFDGKPISEQNLSLWRTHGYRRWHAYHSIMRETSDLAQNSGAVEATGIDCEKMLLALKANYADMIQRWIVTPTGQMTYRMEVFKNLTAGVLAMSRDEIQRERLNLLREKQADKSESSGSFRASRSPDRRSTKTARAPDPKPVADAPDRAEPHGIGAEGFGVGAGGRQGETRVSGGPGKGEPPPQPPTPPTQQAPEPPKPIQAPPTQPAALTAPPEPKIPLYRDPRSRYSLR